MSGSKGWFAQVTVRGRQYHLGVVDGPAHGAVTVAAFKERTGVAEAAEIPHPIVTRDR